MQRKDGVDQAWEVLQDLPFLFAYDTQLTDDLAYVSDLLEPSSSLTDDATNAVTCSPKPASLLPSTLTRPPKVNKFRERQRQEIQSLRVEVQALKARLLIAQRDAVQLSTVSSWERAAREEQCAVGRAVYENERLRENVHTNATFIDDMSRVLRKRPRLLATMVAASDAWKECKLAAHAALRVVAIHAIADRQYSLLPAAFLAAGLSNRADGGMYVAPRVHPQDPAKLIIEYVYQFSIPAPPAMVADAVWAVCSGANGPTLMPGATRNVEKIDARTVYVANRHSDGDQVAHSNVVWKRYHGDDSSDDDGCGHDDVRHVIVWRSVLDDALVPRMAHGMVENDWGWMELCDVEANGSTRLRVLLQVVCIHGTHLSTLEDIAQDCMAAVDAYAFLDPTVRGNFPGRSPAPDLTASLPFALRTFLEGGKQLEVAFKRAVDVVVLRAAAAAKSTDPSP